ncbi:MAG: hypothetical protein IJY89_07310 [Clostridia bacterium]|nr:hypothetical protein [Clostridia bacterium]
MKGDKLAFQNNNLKINSEKELDARLTIHKKTVDGETYYGVYMGDDESRSLAISKSGKIYAGFDKYKLTDSSLWKVTFEDGFARFQNKKEGTYLTVQGKKATLSELDAKDEGQLFEVKKAEKSTRFDEYVSAKGNIVIRFTYEKMAECLNIHAHKGAMVTVYGFYGAAREFLLMAYDFGWDSFTKTFHWFQDNGYTQPDFERMEKFEKFVEKLSEYSGKDIKKEYLTVSWPIFEAFYAGKTSEAV